MRHVAQCHCAPVNSDVRRHLNPTLYALCQKPVIGVALWLSTLCAFPPLLQETPIAVSTPGSVLSTRFAARVAKAYFLSATFTFPSTQDRINDTVVGSRLDTPCYGPRAKRLDDFPVASRGQLGRPLRLKVTIKKEPSGSIVYSQDIASICRAGHNGAEKKTQVMSLIELAEGDYSMEVTNLEPRPDLAALRPSLVIHTGGG
jgi:hypothetical protein